MDKQKGEPLLTFTAKGIYCPRADVYIDPHKPVSRALITHGHSDHAILGHRYYLCTALTAAILKYRLGSFIQIQTVEYAQPVLINQVRFSFHPAGHIPGSAQIRVSYLDEIWVVTGDYKTEVDEICEAYELIPCHTLITETTFALPVYQWKPQKQIIREILEWYNYNLNSGQTTVLLAYALGKSQRLIHHIPADIPVYTHGSVEQTTEVLRKAGLGLRPTIPVSSRVSKKEIQKGITIAPSSVLNSLWIRSLVNPVTATISGWMALINNRKKQAADHGFTLSDHVDWPSLNEVIKQSGTQKVFATHGYTSLYVDWLCSRGYDAEIVSSAKQPATIKAPETIPFEEED
ncbi:MAG: ligase-associated DNA damage response exonuclease [Saprospiraceae bacterium]|nr:ligase-associated DNA damage response exonuclease [Saprospiraceae bacterium]